LRARPPQQRLQPLRKVVQECVAQFRALIPLGRHCRHCWESPDWPELYAHREHVWHAPCVPKVGFLKA